MKPHLHLLELRSYPPEEKGHSRLAWRPPEWKYPGCNDPRFRPNFTFSSQRPTHQLPPLSRYSQDFGSLRYKLQFIVYEAFAMSTIPAHLLTSANPYVLEISQLQKGSAPSNYMPADQSFHAHLTRTNFPPYASTLSATTRSPPSLLSQRRMRPSKSVSLA